MKTKSPKSKNANLNSTIKCSDRLIDFQKSDTPNICVHSQLELVRWVFFHFSSLILRFSIYSLFFKSHLRFFQRINLEKKKKKKLNYCKSYFLVKLANKRISFDWSCYVLNGYVWVKQKPCRRGRDQSYPKIEAFLGLYAIAIMALFFSLTSSNKKSNM